MTMATAAIADLYEAAVSSLLLHKHRLCAAGLPVPAELREDLRDWIRKADRYIAKPRASTRKIARDAQHALRRLVTQSQ